jgi:hypothetical protein
MTLHYHGSPITPVAALYELAGRHFCVSHTRPDDVTRVHQIGQSVMLDNGAFSKWNSGKAVDWSGFYVWCDRWLDYPTTWAVIPDEIDSAIFLQLAFGSLDHMAGNTVGKVLLSAAAVPVVLLLRKRHA